MLETMARLIRDLPPKLLGMGESFDSVSRRGCGAIRLDAEHLLEQLLRLLRDPSLAVQRSAFDLVVRIAEKYVSDLVVEVELETETPPTISLPGELMALLSEKLSPELKQTPADYSKVRGRRCSRLDHRTNQVGYSGVDIYARMARRILLL